MRPSQWKAAVCFCGRARCFSGFYTVDIKPSHLRLSGTACSASVSMAGVESVLTRSSSLYRQQACAQHLRPGSLAFDLGEFLMPLFLFDLVLFMSSVVGERAISPSSAPSVPVTSPGRQRRSSFGIYLQQGKPIRT